uniref:AlNc14C195G8550 protein n=1 Tax=Albugo laibachii Nc14 TaxID=890382 RepID=F0WQ69_9STRA|nr:AlNc14C195G8550 [Albugo laibachii Nc14]CCA26690.1 AlNc14C403G11388 [Albugo laibachii Nc14]|eukprot:CCA26690.1 AlNc14C403G11388 [Albugo laibachii Nc14]
MRSWCRPPNSGYKLDDAKSLRCHGAQLSDTSRIKIAEFKWLHKEMRPNLSTVTTAGGCCFLDRKTA